MTQINKRAAPGSLATQVRSGRKTNSDQVAIAIDMDPTSGIEDEDDDKGNFMFPWMLQLFLKLY